MDIKKELELKQIVLEIIPADKYNSASLSSVKGLNGKICYVSTNKTSDSLIESFKKSKINIKGMIIIDAISKTIKKTPEDSENIYYISSPGSLTEMSLVIGKFLEHDFDYIVFDSITNIGVYQKVDQCTKFISSLINKIKKGKTKALFYAIGKKEDELPRNVSMFVDKVIESK